MLHTFVWLAFYTLVSQRASRISRVEDGPNLVSVYSNSMLGNLNARESLRKSNNLVWYIDYPLDEESSLSGNE